MANIENLELLLQQETAFAEPDCHGEHRRFFCMDCQTTECEMCARTVHASCRVVQLRRFLYNTVVRVKDVEWLLDDASPHIRPYIVNGTPSVHLRPKPWNKPSLPDCRRCAGADCVHGISVGTFCSVECWLSVAATATLTPPPPPTTTTPTTPTTPPTSPTSSTTTQLPPNRPTKPKKRRHYCHRTLRKSPCPRRSRFE